MSEKIDIHKVLEYMRVNAPNYAQAKAERVYMDEYRKTLKSQLYFEALKHGHKSVADREAYAYAHPDYKTHLEGLRVAVENEVNLQWMLIAAQAKHDAWRSTEASNRAIDRSHQ